MIFFVIFIIIPLTELFVFGLVADEIGIFTSLFLALFTAVLGGAIVRHQGLQTIMAMKMSMDYGKIPLDEIFDAFCLVAAGALLITPGFVTDTAGFLLLIPAMRSLLKAWIKNHTNWHVASARDFRGRAPGPDVIEGEYERVDEDKK